jgi:hypothetical protein
MFLCSLKAERHGLAVHTKSNHPPYGPGMPSAGTVARALGGPGRVIAGRTGTQRLGLGWASRALVPELRQHGWGVLHDERFWNISLSSVQLIVWVVNRWLPVSKPFSRTLAGESKTPSGVFVPSQSYMLESSKRERNSIEEGRAVSWHRGVSRV